MTQHQKILNHLKRHKKISSMTAFMHCNVVSLQKRLSELRLKGYQFSKKRIDTDETHYYEYRLIGRP